MSLGEVWHPLPSGAQGFGAAMGAALWGPPGILRLGPSLQLDREKPEQGLALLRQRAELEVWETQKALDQLLFKYQLEVSRPRARGLSAGMPHPCQGQSTPPAPAPSPGPPQVDSALWLRAGHLPLWKGKRGRVWPRSHLNHGPMVPGEDSVAACQRPLRGPRTDAV